MPVERGFLRYLDLMANLDGLRGYAPKCLVTALNIPLRAQSDKSHRRAERNA